jgi:hypothetical protein
VLPVFYETRVVGAACIRGMGVLPSVFTQDSALYPTRC